MLLITAKATGLKSFCTHQSIAIFISKTLDDTEAADNKGVVLKRLSFITLLDTHTHTHTQPGDWYNTISLHSSCVTVRDTC